MTSDVHTLSGAYALNALAPEEAAEFRQHLDGCPACRDEVRELQLAAARMGAAEASTPPPDLKARILAAADRLPQEPPAGQPSTVAPGAPVTSSLADTPADISAASSAPRSADHRRPGRWVGYLAAAAAAVVIAGGGAVGLRAMDDDEPALSSAAVEVFEAKDAHTATVSTDDGGELTVAVSASRKEMAVDTRKLPALDEDHVYQLWSVHGEDLVSAAILSDPEVGAAMGMPDEETQVALTVEPSGGSEQPTTDPIVQVDPYEVLAG
jgi:anti-sigma factor RsiW